MKVLSNSALFKTLTVSNMEPPGEVVQILPQEPTDLGDAQKVQVVLSNSDDTSDSLIGHKYFVSLKTDPWHTEEVECDLSAGNMERKHLKPAEESNSQLQDSQDAKLKHCKKNKPKVSWPFRKNSAWTESTSSQNGGLFNRPLKDICDHKDILAKPILDLLEILCQKGPSSVGVFRKSANLKASKELVGKLNAGREVILEEEPVILLAAIFKDFLRKIPNSVLVTELYGSWMVAMEKMTFEGRIEEIKQLLAKLPKHNCLLLRYVFCVLFHINKCSEVNRMDAYNLAVCIGPNMLWPSKVTSDEFQKEVTAKVVTLMQFLIENCCQIFGNDITALLGEPSQFLSENIDNSDMSSSSHQNDSAYDSTDQDDWKGESEKRQRANSICYQPSRSHEKLRMVKKQNCQTDITAGDDFTIFCSNESIDGNSKASFRPHVPTCPSGFITGQPNMRVNRRSSEPILSVTFNLQQINQQELVARSHDDCSVPFDLDFNQHPTKKQVSEESFTRQIRSRRLDNFNASSHSELSTASSSKASSVSSLASSWSNMSENSVFINSPLVSPTCTSQENNDFSDHAMNLEANSIQDPTTYAKGTMEKAKKPVKKTYSWGPSRTLNTNQESWKENILRENPPTCQTVHEDKVGGSDTTRFRTRLMSADEVFQQIDIKKRCSPPSYTKAIEENSPPILSMKEMTVRSLRQQVQLKEHKRFGCTLVAGQKDRPCSLTEELLYPLSQNQINSDFCDKQTITANHCEALHICSEAALHLTKTEKALQYRRRTMSESANKRWSFQAYKEFQYAKESCV
ncbi:T cell activation RhoGTPase activating protein b isoform X2 [Narcine bancroftii]